MVGAEERKTEDPSPGAPGDKGGIAPRGLHQEVEELPRHPIFREGSEAVIDVEVEDLDDLFTILRGYRFKLQVHGLPPRAPLPGRGLLISFSAEGPRPTETVITPPDHLPSGVHIS